MKVGFINQHTYNHGDEAAKKALLRSLEKVNREYDVSVFYNQYRANINKLERKIVSELDGKPLIIDFHDKFTFTQKVFVFSSFFMPVYLIGKIVKKQGTIYRLYTLIEDSDLIISAPGGVNIGPYKDWVYLWGIAVAVKLKKPVFVYSVSIGESPSKVFNYLARRLLKKVDFLSLRDSVSQQFATKKKIDYLPSIDTAFLKTNEHSKIVKSDCKNGYAVFVPNDLVSWHPEYQNMSEKNLFDFYVDLLNIYVGCFNKIVMIPQLFGERSDESYFRKIKAASKVKEKIEVLSQNTSSDAQQETISESEFLIGARYHSIVFAINNSVPFVSLSYEHKMSGMLDLLSIDGVGIDMRNFNVSGFKKEALISIENAIKDRVMIQSQCEKGKELANDMAFEVFQRMLAVVENTNNNKLYQNIKNT
jgi:colanic acid/amylovoran biosynthesis protein